MGILVHTGGLDLKWGYHSCTPAGGTGQVSCKRFNRSRRGTLTDEEIFPLTMAWFLTPLFFSSQCTCLSIAFEGLEASTLLQCDRCIWLVSRTRTTQR